MFDPSKGSSTANNSQSLQSLFLGNKATAPGQAGNAAPIAPITRASLPQPISPASWMNLPRHDFTPTPEPVRRAPAAQPVWIQEYMTSNSPAKERAARRAMAAGQSATIGGLFPHPDFFVPSPHVRGGHR